MRYFLVAGEPSGDLHASNLMKGILKSDPQAEFRFWGGELMAQVGGKENLMKDYRETSFFGFVEVVRNLRTILRQVDECKAQIVEFKPDVVILVDYAGFNLKIARFAHERGITTHYYIAPKVWAWNEGRVKSLRRYIDKLFIIFPFEVEYFRSKGIEPIFEGNPLVDSLYQRCQSLPTREEFVQRNGLDERPIVALLAGSRRSEIRANLELMVRTAEHFKGHQFVVAGVSWIERAEYEKLLQGSDVRIVCNQTYELLSLSEAAVVTSGTATLETALMNIPQVVLYRIPPSHHLIRKFLLKIPYISLVNLNLNREAVREIIQSGSEPARIVQALGAIVEGGTERERTLQDYAQLREVIGEAGASERFAQRMVELLK